MSQRSFAVQLSGLAVCLGCTFAAAALGAIASVDAGDFYATLSRPDWAPPAWLFGPVWTTLYLAMALAAWLVWRAGRLPAVRMALALYLVQLVFNALWSWLFFGWKLGGLAFAEILLLWLLILATLVAFWRVRPLAGLLLVPYLLWVSFAVVLNYSVWQLNPQIPG